jgi:hypothetical protein
LLKIWSSHAQARVEPIELPSDFGES